MRGLTLQLRVLRRMRFIEPDRNPAVVVFHYMRITYLFCQHFRSVTVITSVTKRFHFRNQAAFYVHLYIVTCYATAHNNSGYF